MELGQSSTSCNIFSVSRGMLETSEFLCPQVFRSVNSLVLSRPKSCEQFFFSLFVDNFYNAFFQRILVHNDGLDILCPNLFLRCGEVNSVFCILLRSIGQWFWWFTFLDFFVSVITSVSLALLSRQIVPLPKVEDKLHTLHGFGNVSSLCTRVSNNIFSTCVFQEIMVPILSSRRRFSFSVVGFCLRMYWHRIAAASAAAAAAAAAFRGGRVLPAPQRQRFPDARLGIRLRFNVVRIFWAVLVSQAILDQVISVRTLCC